MNTKAQSIPTALALGIALMACGAPELERDAPASPALEVADTVGPGGVPGTSPGTDTQRLDPVYPMPEAEPIPGPGTPPPGSARPPGEGQPSPQPEPQPMPLPEPEPVPGPGTPPPGSQRPPG